MISPEEYEYVYEERKADKDGARGYDRRLTAKGIEKFILSPLFEFTLMRYPFNGQAALYMPNTLRELHNFIKNMYQATKGRFYPEDYRKEGEDEKRAYQHIYNWFSSEIIHRWAKEYLTREQYRFLMELWNAPDNRKLELAYEFYMKQEGTLNLPVKMENDKEIKRKSNYEEYYKRSGKRRPSIGDIIYAARYFEERDLVQEGLWRQFNFALFSLISLRMKYLNEFVPDRMKDYITDLGGYFGYSSLKLLSVYSFMKGEKKDYVSLPAGRIEYRKSGDDYLDVSSLIDLVNKKKPVPKEKGDYRRFELLFFFFQFDKFSITEKQITNDQRSNCFPLWSRQTGDNPSIAAITKFDRLAFDVMNPCYLSWEYKKVCHSLQKAIMVYLYPESRELIEQLFKDMAACVIDKEKTREAKREEVIKKGLEDAKLAVTKADEITNKLSLLYRLSIESDMDKCKYDEEGNKNWQEYYNLPPVPLYDLAFMSDLIDHIESMDLVTNPLVLKEESKEVKEMIDRIYNEIITEFLKEQDNYLFNDAETFFNEEDQGKDGKEEKTVHQRDKRHISEAYIDCPVIKEINEANLEYVQKIVTWMLTERVRENERMIIDTYHLDKIANLDELNKEPKDQKME